MRRIIYCTAAIISLLCTVTSLHAAKPKAAAAPTPVPTPADAVRMAVADLATLPLEQQVNTRYFLTYDRSPEFYGAFNYALNTSVSHSVNYYWPVQVADGWLLRVDLAALWPEVDDFNTLLLVLEDLAKIEPYFHTIGVAEVKKGEEKVLVDVTPYLHTDGKRYTKKWVMKEVVEEVTGVEHSLHLLGEDGDAAPIFTLATVTKSAIPIMRADWFMLIILSQDPLVNGRYYQFQRISKSSGGKTAEQLWLERQGVDYDAVQKIRSDQRLATRRSQVTGSPRAVEYFFTSAVRASIGPAACFLTRDWFVGEVAPDRHPIKNLLGYVHDGSEAMGFNGNGTISFVLTDDKRELIDVAPQKLVSDRTVPIPYPTNLEPPISCIRCHGPQEMWKPVNNDIKTLTTGDYRINIFDDTSSEKEQRDVIDRLRGLYEGDATEALRIASNTHAAATFKITRGMQVIKVTEVISAVYNDFRFGNVTPQQACLELGWRVTSPTQAVEVFNRIVPVLPPNTSGISPETDTVGSLRKWTDTNGLFVSRDDWQHEYADIMLRAQTEAIRQKAIQERENQ